MVLAVLVGGGEGGGEGVVGQVAVFVHAKLALCGLQDHVLAGIAAQLILDHLGVGLGVGLIVFVIDGSAIGLHEDDAALLLVELVIVLSLPVLLAQILHNLLVAPGVVSRAVGGVVLPEVAVAELLRELVAAELLIGVQHRRTIVLIVNTPVGALVSSHGVGEEGQTGVHKRRHLVLADLDLVLGLVAVLAQLDKVVLQVAHDGVSGDLHEVDHPLGHLIIGGNAQQVVAVLCRLVVVIGVLVVVLAVGVEPGLSVADDGVIPLFLLAAEFAADDMAGLVLAVDGHFSGHADKLFAVQGGLHAALHGDVIGLEGQGLDGFLVGAVTVDAAKSSPGRHRQDQHASHQTYGDTIALFHGVFLLVGVNERILQDLPKNPNPERVSFYSAYYNSDS